MNQSLNIRWRAVLWMQQRLQSLRPGSDEAHIIEHAISIAINSKSQKQNSKCFRYDIVRNARFSFRRTKARQHRLWQKTALLTPAWTEDAEAYTYSDLEAELRTVVAKSGKKLSRCFDDMINGESVSATARACGVSQRTANRLRQKVRQIVQTYLDSQETA